MTDQLTLPLDDAGLSAIEHALGAVTEVAEDGGRTIHGADYSMAQLLNFWSGYDPADGVHVGYIDGIPLYHTGKQCLSEHDLIRALVAEVRRLRGASDD